MVAGVSFDREASVGIIFGDSFLTTFAAAAYWNSLAKLLLRSVVTLIYVGL